MGRPFSGDRTVYSRGLLSGLARLCVQLPQPVCRLTCRKSVGFFGGCLLALLPETWKLHESGRKNERNNLRLILRPLYINTLQCQEGFFPQNSSPVSGQAPIRSDHPVARHDDADRIMTDRTADCLCGHPFEPAFLCDFVGNPSIRNRFSKGDFTHDLSDTIAEIGAYQMYFRKESGIVARKINMMAISLKTVSAKGYSFTGVTETIPTCSRTIQKLT